MQYGCLDCLGWKAEKTMESRVEFEQYLDQHEYPKILYRFPILVRCVYVINFILTLRNWFVRRALRALEKEQPANFSFLDAGCGMGEFALGAAQRHAEAHVVGIDYTVSNIPLAKSVAREMNLKNIEFAIGDLATLRTENRYDLILCNSTLQFIKKDEAALDNLHAMLKSKGVMLLYVPVRYHRYLKYSETNERKYLSDFFYKYHDDFLMHRYSEDEITKKILNAGFKIRSSQYAYGVYGAIAFELYSFLLAVVKKSPVVLSLPVIFVYAFLVFPIQFVLMIADFVTKKSIGNGLLIIADKNL
jgi:2-polyprenyl-3-methyl-5-hydroxy-6-metoxy-1,4-benzoquinol methylase